MTIIGTDVKYGSVSNTVNAAVTPDLLDVGSIGIYTVDSTTGLFKLVVKSGSPPAGTVSSTTVKDGFLKLVQGLGGGDFFVSEFHDVKGIQSITGSKYRVGTGQTVYIGYNPNTGLGDVGFVATSTFVNTVGNFYNPNHREAGVKLRQRNRGNNSYGADILFNYVVSPNDTALTVVNGVIAAINAYTDPAINGTIFTGALTGNNLTPPVQTASSTATTGGTIAAATYYGKVVALNALGFSLGSNEISQATTGATSTITWNWGLVTGATSYRVYVGTSAGNQTAYTAVGNVATLVQTAPAPTSGTVPTSTALGISIVVSDIYSQYEAAVYDGLQNATVAYTQPSPGSGDPYQLSGLKGNWVKTEAESAIYRGDLYTMSTLEKKLPKTVDLTKTYDTYQMVSINTTLDKTGQKATTDNRVSTLIAFVVQGNVLDTNQQTNFEQIMTDIFASTAQISA